MTAETYAIEIKLNERHVVQSALVRFHGLYHQLGLSPHTNEILAIKLEVDTNPPAGAGLATSFVEHHVAVHMQHHDQASLLAGKLHALLQREYVKGRDWYDLDWYLRQPQWVSPNLAMLNNALTQSGWLKGEVTAENWRTHVLARLQGLDWRRVVGDVQRFLMDQDDLNRFAKDELEGLLGQRPRTASEIA